MEISQVIEMLGNAEKARVQGLEKACDLLHPRNAATELLERIVAKPAFDQNSLELLKKVAPVVQACHVQKRITDWPFENFWCDSRDPLEPRHSRLIGYFIDPKDACGKFLLEKFLCTARNKLKPLSGDQSPRELKVDDLCEVDCEKGHIDILVTRGKDDKKLPGRYAVIVENKVHPDTAPDQDHSLWLYVQRVKSWWGFRDGEIYVVYLPLTGGFPGDNSLCHPDNPELSPLKRSQISVVTFKDEIRDWLKTALGDKKALPEGDRIDCGCMRDNLKHYLNLVNYLLRQEKERKMNEKILAVLQEAHNAGKLPTWGDIEGLCATVQSLKECYEVSNRVNLLLNVHRLLDERRLNPECFIADKPEKLVNSPYDSRCANPDPNVIEVRIRVNNFAIVCVGLENGELYAGFRVVENKDDDFKEVAKNHGYTEGQDNDDWYGWKWEEVMTYEKCLTAAAALAEEVLKMYHIVDEYRKKQRG